MTNGDETTATTTKERTAPQLDYPEAIDIIARLLVFSFLATPASAKVVRLEDQPEIVQTLYHWSGFFTLIWAVFALLGLIAGIIWWRQGRRIRREGDKEVWQSSDIEGGHGG